MSDLIDEFPDTMFKELLRGLNWLKLYDIEAVLARQWGYSESICRKKCREVTQHIASLKEQLIFSDPAFICPEETHAVCRVVELALLQKCGP